MGNERQGNCQPQGWPYVRLGLTALAYEKVHVKLAGTVPPSVHVLAGGAHSLGQRVVEGQGCSG